MPPPPGAKLTDVQELMGRIEKLVAGGEGLARFEGVTIFVPRSAPGDRLRIKITERKPDYGRAEIVEILEPGPDRRPDPVPELSLTGVCDLQHLDEAAESRLEAEAVRETLEHIGKFTLPPDTPAITGEPWGYRLKTQIHTDIDPVAGGVQVGYHARGTNTVIPVSRRPLLVPELKPCSPSRQPSWDRTRRAGWTWRRETAGRSRRPRSSRGCLTARSRPGWGTSPTPTTPAASSSPTAGCCRS